METLAAVEILRGYFPDLRIRVVNVVDLMRLQDDREHPHGLSDAEFDSYFTRDKPVIFAYHGYPWLIHRLTYRRTNHDNFHVRGYVEEGTTTTPVRHLRDEPDRPLQPGHRRHRPGAAAARRSARTPATGCATRSSSTGSTCAPTARTCRRSGTGSGPARPGPVTSGADPLREPEA